MDKDQIKGTIKEKAGKVQEALGRATGNKTQEGKGLINQDKGKVQKKVGDVKDALKKGS